LAVLSASTVCIEALACNARVAAGYYVDNQKEFYEYMRTNNFIYGLDSLLELQLPSVRDIINFPIANIVSLAKNVASRYIKYFKLLE
jgi:hypothetical protein